MRHTSPAVPPAPSVEVSDVRVIRTTTNVPDDGLDHWIDGTFGVVGRRGRLLFISPNGPHLAVHRLGRRARVLAAARSRGAPTSVFGNLVSARTPVATPGSAADDNSGMDHLSGGPALYDGVDDRIAFVYHGELHRHGDPTSYYSQLGVASSTDGGRAFIDHGPVLTSWVPANDWRDIGGCVELGPGPFVVHDGWLMLWFQDKSPRQRVNLSVARAPIADVLRATRSGEPWLLQKFHDGNFGEPGLGGTSTDLLPALTADRRIEWFDVARLEAHGLFLIVYSTVAWSEKERGRWTLQAALSWDGIHWGAPTALLPESHAETLYVTVWARNGPSQRVAPGDELDLVFTRSPVGGFDRWKDATVEIATLRMG